MSSRKLLGKSCEKPLLLGEQKTKIDETRKLIGLPADRFPVLCLDASIARYLGARNWNIKKAAKMLKETLKWRMEYKPEKIRWGDIADEAETGKIYRADYCDKHGRTVLVMRPGFQNTNSIRAQIRYLVYCLENAIMHLKPDQEQMVWLIDFQGWNMSSISVKATKETAHVLQNHYPERLGLAILYNPPKIFESFWMMVKPVLEPKTYKKVKFIYNDDPQSQKRMEELFDMEKLEFGFGGKNPVGFNYEAYRERMLEDDKKMTELTNSGSFDMGELQQDNGSENSDEATSTCSGYASSFSLAGNEEKGQGGVNIDTDATKETQMLDELAL
ncbi:hypothetical protein Nepgr_024811 [Nepenthes gracilis]|uniref:CRAL-TRIO domain-containing protein n=1 Tax=Nepenthes gracilis TaxID=150966 RepID=A0AAD3T3J8_NEPGR|nr:hypothetical protein Nepgr_024811 [Nepenthes gracilis]